MRRARVTTPRRGARAYRRRGAAAGGQQPLPGSFPLLAAEIFDERSVVRGSGANKGGPARVTVFARDDELSAREFRRKVTEPRERVSVTPARRADEFLGLPSKLFEIHGLLPMARGPRLRGEEDECCFAAIDEVDAVLPADRVRPRANLACRESGPLVSGSGLVGVSGGATSSVTCAFRRQPMQPLVRCAAWREVRQRMKVVSLAQEREEVVSRHAGRRDDLTQRSLGQVPSVHGNDDAVRAIAMPKDMVASFARSNCQPQCSRARTAWRGVTPGKRGITPRL